MCRAFTQLVFSGLLICAADDPSIAGPPVNVQRPAPELKTSLAFQRALASKLTARWKNVPLRTVLDGVSSTWKVGILLDRRIDPTQRMALALIRAPLKDAVAAIARAAKTQVVVEGNVFYIGPPDAVTALTEAIDDLTTARRRASKSWPRARRLAVARRRTLHWNDLDRPRDLVKSFAAQYKLSVDGLEKIPHDLLAGATVPSCSATQGLSLLLVQYGLTFRWKEDGSGIVVVPLRKKR